MPNPLDRYLKVSDAVIPAPTKPIDKYLKIAQSSQDVSRTIQPDMRAPVKTVEQLMYESMPHQMEIDREPTILQAILPRASRTGSDHPIAGMANLALDLGGLAGRAIMSAKKPDGESYLHALERSEGTYDDSRAGRVANTLESMGRDPFNVLMAPIERMGIKAFGVASRAYKPGEKLEEIVAQKTMPEFTIDPRNPGNFKPATETEMASGVLFPSKIPAPIDANLPEGSWVGNPMRNRVPGTAEGAAYDKALEGVPLEFNGEPPKFFRGGPSSYRPHTLSEYDENGAFVFGAKDRPVSLSYTDITDKSDMRQMLQRALLHNEPLANGVTPDELRTTLRTLNDPREMSPGLQDAYSTLVKAGLHNPPRPQMQEFYMFGKNVKNIPHNEQYIDWVPLEEGEHVLENGFDAVIHRNVRDPGNHVIPGSTLPTDVLQTNKQNLAKSIYNEGTWDLSNPNIYKMLPFAGATGGIIGAANSRQSGD